ncbi:hypothetical protein O8C85_03540 [Aliarcobacter butzleri]|uniref:hypothetical protein n=1 Tax=Aliarcobacter butzleri TaxID=28197 RepID=UPI00263E8261|nr:hypothetical protein [Aliarcobacter butzleri]MDN5097597.1 hypothetical protein [Aliarcobacter butzleri]
MNKCSCGNCDLEIFENSNKCILHCEKDDWIAKIPNKELKKLFLKTPVISAKYKMKLELFWNIFKQKITEDKVQNFDNIIFPTNAEFEIKEFENKILKFNHCKFIDIFYFYFLNNVQRVEFDNCTFYKSVEFEYIVFKEDFLFQNCNIHKDAELLFKDINFNGVVSFIKTKVKSKFTFTQVRFNSIALFNNSEIEDLFFQNTFFRKESNFLDIKLSKVGSRETARIIKDSFEKQNNIIEANKFYALEMKAREDELERDIREGKNFFEWLVFKIHGLASNHSQDWLLPIFWILNITFSLFITEKSIEIFDFNLIAFIPLISMIILGITIAIINYHTRRTILLFILSFINFGIFKIISKKHSLDCVSDKINPFSIMTELSKLDFSTMIYKITIAYLIYQLIISIRQNTRRK